MLSRAFLASLNVCGCSDLAAGAERDGKGVEVDGEGVKDLGIRGSLNEREETSLSVSFLDPELLASPVCFGTDVTVATPFGWTIVIGTLRLLGVGKDEETGPGLMNHNQNKCTRSRRSQPFASPVGLLFSLALPSQTRWLAPAPKPPQNLKKNKPRLQPIIKHLQQTHLAAPCPISPSQLLPALS